MVWSGLTAGIRLLSSTILTPAVGPMHWGHARGKDLVHWEHLPVALAPEGRRIKMAVSPARPVVDGDTLALIYTGHKFHGDPSDEETSIRCSVWPPAATAFILNAEGMVLDTPPACTTSATRKCGRRG